MNTKSIKYFLAVAEYRNFTRAGEHLFITQSALSHHIAELEAELETKLFTRTTRSVTLTPAGEIMHRSAKELIALLDRITDDIKKADSGVSGELVIGHLMGPFKEILPEVTRIFQLRYPDVEIRYVRKNSGPLSESFLRGEVDVIFSMTPFFEGFVDFEWRALQADGVSIFMDHNHPLAKEETIDFSVVSKERFVALDETEAPIWNQMVMRVCASRGFVPNIVEKADRIDALLMEVKAGLALTIMPTTGCHYYFSDLHYFEVDGDDTKFSDAVAWRTGNNNPVVPLFISVLEDYLSDSGKTKPEQIL